MIALLLNESGRLDLEIREVVEFAHEQVLGRERLNVAVRVKRRAKGDGGGGQAWDRTIHGGRKWAGRIRFGVSLTVANDSYPHWGRPRASWYAKQMREWYGIGSVERAYVECGLLYDAGERRLGRWPIYYVADWQEHLIHLAAHEFAHVLAYSRDRKRGHGSEVECEIVAERVLNAWRDRPKPGPALRTVTLACGHKRPLADDHYARVWCFECEKFLDHPLTNATGLGIVASASNPVDPEEDPMSKTPSPAKIEQLRSAYMTAYNNFATDRSEVAAELGVSKTVANGLLKTLAAAGLVDSIDVNDEAQGSSRRGQYQELTWQCNETYDSIGQAQAAYLFDLAFGLVREEPADYDATPSTEPAKCAECGHLHWFGVEQGYGPCPIEGCECVGLTPDSEKLLSGARSGIKTASGPGRAHVAQVQTPAADAAKTTEEVTMSTTAIEEPQAPAEEAAKPAAAAQDSIDDGLVEALTKQVKGLVKKPEFKTAPSGSYTAIKVDGKPIGYLHPQTRKGALVHLTISAAAAKRIGVKGAEPHEKGAVKAKVYVTKAAQVEPVAKALAAAVAAEEAPAK